MNIPGLFFSPHGRIGRLAYMLSSIAISLMALLAATSFLPGMSLALLSDPANLMHAMLVTLPFMAAHVMVGIKRAHDLGRSGSWFLGWTFAAYGSALLSLSSFAVLFFNVVAGSVLLIAALVAGIGAAYQLGFKMIFKVGDDGNNEYGAPDCYGSGSDFAAGSRQTTSGAGFSEPRGGGGNWMDNALLSVEQEVVSRHAQPATRASSAGAPAAFGRRTGKT